MGTKEQNLVIYELLGLFELSYLHTFILWMKNSVHREAHSLPRESPPLSQNPTFQTPAQQILYSVPPPN